jgi:NAD(P)-dependent dehydrogenase (short-subunit alcohol dehydrogenase family)
MTGGRLEGRRLLVTGAAGAIGAAARRLFEAEGASVVATDLHAGDGVVAADLSSAAAIEDLVGDTVARLGGLDGVVHVAGILRPAPVVEMDDELWGRHLDVNLTSGFRLARAGVPHLARGDAPTIVLTSSIGGTKGGPGGTAYSASKGAVNAFTRTLASELGPQGIRVNAIAPGWVDTAFNDPFVDRMGGRSVQDQVVAGSVALGRQAHPDEIAEVLLFLASRGSSYVNGHVLVVDGG